MSYIIAGDLGKRQDPATIAICERVEYPQVRNPRAPRTIQIRTTDWKLPEVPDIVYSKLFVRRLEMFPLGTTYKDIVQRYVDLATHPAFAADNDVIFDATGPGDPVAELMRDKLPLSHAVYITGGQHGRNRTDNPNDHLVPKPDIAMSLLLWYQSGRIEVNIGHDRTAEGRRQAEVFALYDAQLAKFQEKVRANHSRAYENETDEDHDDLVIAVALACWWAQQKWGFEEPVPVRAERKKQYDPLRS